MSRKERKNVVRSLDATIIQEINQENDPFT